MGINIDVCSWLLYFGRDYLDLHITHPYSLTIAACHKTRVCRGPSLQLEPHTSCTQSTQDGTSDSCPLSVRSRREESTTNVYCLSPSLPLSLFLSLYCHSFSQSPSLYSPYHCWSGDISLTLLTSVS